jgi:hypothetical protein
MTRAGVGAGLALGLVLGGTGSAPALAQDAAVIDKTLELEFWRSVATSTDPALFDAYLQQFPNGTFATLARVKAAALRRAAPMPAPPPSLPPPRPHRPPYRRRCHPGATDHPGRGHGDRQPCTRDAADGGVGHRTGGERSGRPCLAGAAGRHAGNAGPATFCARCPSSGRAARGPCRRAPRLDTVPSITLPARFCSAEERNAFHAQVFRPASEAAEANNTRAIGYLHAIQARYDAMAMGDPDQRNALAREGLAYKPIADATFQTQQALVRQFDALMAVPIAGCAPAR